MTSSIKTRYSYAALISGVYKSNLKSNYSCSFRTRWRSPTTDSAT